MVSKVTVTVPATSANLGPGFDCLGLALGLYNTMTFTDSSNGLSVEITGEGSNSLPIDQSNLVVQSARQLFLRAARHPRDLQIIQHNRIPVASGLGSSAAAVTAGIAGANALLGSPFKATDLVRLATEIEGHPDNVAPALFGDLVLTFVDGDRLIVERIPMPEMSVIVVLPDYELTTEQARAVLPKMIPREDAIYNVARVSLLVRALAVGDFDQLAVAMQDRLHQPYRLRLIPGMEHVFEAAKSAGAAAVALSGAGPSVIAFAPSNHDQINTAIRDAFNLAGLSCRSWILPIDRKGIQVTVE